MQKTILACACVLLLSTGSVLAQAQQAQPAPGASSEVGPGATKSTAKHTNVKKGTTGMATGKMKKAGTSPTSAPSSSGNVGAGTKQ